MIIADGIVIMITAIGAQNIVPERTVIKLISVISVLTMLNAASMTCNGLLPASCVAFSSWE